jgi:hypothetical protein
MVSKKNVNRRFFIIKKIELRAAIFEIYASAKRKPRLF